MSATKHAKHILAVGGGKGGVGKSIFAIILSTSLAAMGKTVVMVDLDLGGANLHNYLGIMDIKMPTLAHFFTNKVKSLDELIIDTKVNNLRLISGAEYVPLMSNTTAAIKVALAKGIKSIDSDFIVIDLGAGMDLTTLDFFTFSNRGFLVTLPEPASIMNTYRFIKGALYRKLRNVFYKHKKIAFLLEKMVEKSGADNPLRLNWLMEKVHIIDPEAFLIVKEIAESFQPYLILNRISSHESNHLVEGLLAHCQNKYNIHLRYLGNLPNSNTISSYLMDIPSFLTSRHGKEFSIALNVIVKNLIIDSQELFAIARQLHIKTDYDDITINKILLLIDSLDDSIFEETSRKLWKLRLFFKPIEVVRFLMNKGIRDEVFF
ncbi:MAG: P-loop NTPase [Candidatus Magnetoovum sp. WYHC-5]|nr:P-loop NTPase [Candidatus Magnetoovum sp. WYHC-5]